MTAQTLTPATVIRLEKAAVDNGFDVPLPRQANWLAFSSTKAPLRVWLSVTGKALFHAAVSQQNVARALAGLAASVAVPLPEGACAVLTVGDVPALDRLLRRAFQLSRTLPDELLQTFQKNTASLPKTTEAERLVVQRVGQDLFRAGLLDYWEGRCAITGLAVRELLRASHIKPWAHCTTDAERLDVWNGLLLAPHLDAAFDAGFLTVTDDGEVLLSPLLSPESRAQLGFTQPLRVHGLTAGHRTYLPWHREKVFRRGTEKS